MIVGALIPGRKNIFLDCGGNDGCSVRKFRKDYDFFHRFFVYTFEPNQIYKDIYKPYKNHKLIPAIVHNRDGLTEFYLDHEDGDGSTIFKEKLTRDNGGYGILDTNSPELVETIDLSRWISRNVAKTDYVVLKLDIEGAEYDVLEKMDTDGTLALVDKLFIEWHWNKVGISEARHEQVVLMLRKRGIKAVDWDAKGY